MIIDFNITNYCNAKCPTCKRFDPNNYPQLESGIKVVHMDLAEFKNILDENKNFFADQICYFCGEFGDPLMHPNIKEFAELANNVFKEVVVYTNGGLQRDSFFDHIINTENNISVKFGIDGTSHEINNKYRINVNTELALENMLNLAKKTKKKAWWDYTIFEHNKHEIEDVIEMAQKNNIILNLRCNLRPSIYGVNRISQDDYNSYKEIARKYQTLDQVSFDIFWIDSL